MSKPYHLIIWEMFPETTHLYLIPSSEILLEFSNNELKYLHNKYGGSSDEDLEILEKLNIKLIDWFKYKIEDFIESKNIELIIRTGYMI